MGCMKFHVRAELCLFERQKKREHCAGRREYFTVFGKKLLVL